VIVVTGEALIDLTPARCGAEEGYVPRLGGSSFNVAVGLGRLAAPTAYLGRLSTDRFGRQLRAHLEANGVDTRLTEEGDEPTPLALVHLGDGEPEYGFYIQGTADRALRPGAVPRLPDAAAAVHFGSLSLLLEPGASALEDLGRREAGRRLLTLDPNVRPAMIDQPEVYRRRLADWVGRVDLVKVSRADLDWLHPGVDPEDIARAWLDRGAALVIVTAGGDGSIALTHRARATAAAPAVEVVDTVGAGDTFTAGTLAHLHQRGALRREALAALDAPALEALLAHAATASALACTRPGADPPTAEEVAAGRR